MPQQEQDNADKEEDKPFAALEGLMDDVAIEEDDGPETSVAQVPWYLQDEDIPQPPAEETNPMLERQRIPDVPEDAPPILRPLLKQISVDLGLDYLSVLDLRKLDPPPALGANLLMVFGSARSEKHLNISADRLCRWLRTEYKLSPVADGLLGRNELKLKLRRKARRMKMLGSSAAANLTSTDDGISTGWVCVDVGMVDNGTSTTTSSSALEGPKFVGFGRRVDGAKIVVQMMTEEKRGDVDLEGLWREILDRAMRKKIYDAEAQAEIDEEANVGSGERTTTGALSDLSTDKFSPRSTRSSPLSSAAMYPPRPRQNVRGFHTSSRRHEADVPSLNASDEEQFDEFDLEPQLMLQSVSEADSYAPVDAVSQVISLNTQLEYLKRLPPASALKVLGKGQHDRSSTTFLRSFHRNLPLFLETKHWESAIEIQCYAIKIGHPRYTKLHLMTMIRGMQAAAVVIPESTFLAAFEVILLSPHGLDDTSWVEGTKYDGMNALRRDLGLACSVLEAMMFQGHSVTTLKVFAILHLAVSYPSFTPPRQSRTKALDLPEETLAPLSVTAKTIIENQYYVRKALSAVWEQPSNSLYVLLMRTYIEQDNWAGFWDIWRTLARILRPRTPEMYTIMFRGIAGTQNQAQLQEALSERIPEMEKENPPVALEGEVAVAVKECLLAAEVDLGKGTWADLWMSVSGTDHVH